MTGVLKLRASSQREARSIIVVVVDDRATKAAKSADNNGYNPTLPNSLGAPSHSRWRLSLTYKTCLTRKMNLKRILIALACTAAPSMVAAYNSTDYVISLRGEPAGTSCAKSGTSAVYRLRFMANSIRGRPNGDDAMAITVGCKNGPLTFKDVKNCDNATLTEGRLTCVLVDDQPHVSLVATCPNTECTDQTPFTLTGADGKGKNMTVVGNLLAPNLQGNCKAGENVVNIIQVNGDTKCIRTKKPLRAARSVNVMVLVNCDYPSRILPVISMTFNDNVAIEKQFNNKTNMKNSAPNIITWDTHGGQFAASLSNNATSCPKNREPADKALRITSCTATLDGQPIKCSYGIESIGGNTALYEWIGTGPQKYVEDTFSPKA
ncbi:hypothetical protein SeLEV6574_g02108 [Synchytrium endobioticum]|uniref:Uncharacterized protein n=1 Tax=Synchytrium endobioticum TaxID=286115 RepID=A0A507DA86_9FUNG|nr:hypothetical protein SeLEV6574_g02108 [Synchytrium endobioticum]